MSFDDDTAVRPAGDGAFEGDIADGWATPRGPLGGYVMAIVVRAMELAVDDPERTARSATMHSSGPRARAGDGTHDGRARRALADLDERAARAERQAARDRDRRMVEAVAGGPPLGEPAMPEVEPPTDRGPLAADFPRDQPPAFLQKLSMQHRFGDPPFTGSGSGEVGGWLGLLEPRPIDAPAIAVLADAWFPAPWPRLAELAPAPTIDLTVHFRVPLPIADGLLLGRFRNRLVRDGFFDEDGELWAEDGTLVAQSRQLGLLIGLPG